MNRVRAGSSPCSVSAMSAPSTLETKWLCRPGRRERRQRARRHRRTEVGAADADIDHVGHRLAVRAAHPALAHVGGEGEHLVAFGLDRRRDVDAVDQDRRAGKIAQRAVQRRAPFGRIDQFAAEHRVALGGDVGRLGEREQQPQRLGVDPLLGEIVEQVAEDRVEAVEASRIGGEEIGNRAGEQRGAPGGELGEDDRGRRFGHGLSLSGAAHYALRPPPPRRACFYAAPIAIARHPPDARRRAAARRGGIVDRAGRAHRAGRPQRLGQVDAAAHRRGRSDRRTRERASSSPTRACATCRRSPTSAAMRRRSISSSPASARPTIPIAPAR